MTDALTKYVELVPLPNKEANTVGNAIFDKWYCHFGAPLDIVTDQGKEFCARLSDELFKRLGTNHLTMSPHHPQCNSQAEVANKRSQNTWPAFVMTLRLTGNFTWLH
jgi:hypothetical protein